MPDNGARFRPDSGGQVFEQRHHWAASSTEPGGAMLFDPTQAGVADPTLFDPQAFGSRAHAVGQGGRQAAWFVEGSFGQGVLRHYQRGGLIARLSQDRYIWRGEDATRAFAEFRIMQYLNRQGLRVPAPLAAGYWRSVLTYRAALLTRRITDARPLAIAFDSALIPEVAQAIVAMHRAGAWHADLNAYNIMLDAHDQVWLIDFDRATLGKITDSARHANLARLQRSLVKVAGARGEAFGRMLTDAYDRLWPVTKREP